MDICSRGGLFQLGHPHSITCCCGSTWVEDNSSSCVLVCIHFHSERCSTTEGGRGEKQIGWVLGGLSLDNTYASSE